MGEAVRAVWVRAGARVSPIGMAERGRPEQRPQGQEQQHPPSDYHAQRQKREVAKSGWG
jgi:hypothetical protein